MSLRRRLASAAMAAMVVTGLAACGGLPDTSPVVDGRRLDEPVIDPVRVVPQAPRDGASQAEVVLGFIRSGEDSDETRATGRSYLAPASTDRWRWSAEPVTVYDSSDSLKIKQVTPESVQLSTVAVATVSPDGRYAELPAGTVATVTFGLTKVGGEWRIELPPGGFGLWLDSNAFDRLYVPRQLNFVTPDARRLIPDVRWFLSGAKMATTLARAQLEPVPAYLAGAVTTGVPANTKLAVNAVPIDNGQAAVNLTAAGLNADPAKRTAMWAQLVATLSQVSAVSAVSLAVEGTSLDLPSRAASLSSAGELGFESVPFPTHDTALVRGDDTKITRIDPRYIPDDTLNKLRRDTSRRADDPVAIPEGWHALSLSVDGLEVAAVGGDLKDLSRWRGAQFVEVPRFATELTRVAYDSAGYLWVGGTAPDGTGRIWTMPTSSMSEDVLPEPVETPWLKGRKVTALTVAPDGTRMLVVTTKADGSDVQLGLAGIVRDSSGRPRSVDEPWRQAEPLTLIRDVTWLEADSFAVLGRIAATEPIRPWIGAVGAGLDGVRRRGSVPPKDARLGPVKDGRWITSVGGPRGIVVITDDNRVLARAGAAWREIATGTDLLVPGH